MSPERKANAAAKPASKPDITVTAFGSRAFARLWTAQFITSVGDWIGLLAITVTAAHIWGDNSGTAIGLVIGARIVPSLFFGQIGGVLADRWNRYRIMVVCDVCRAGLYLVLPFVTTVWQLILVSLAIEVFTLLWIPAKEALVPSLLPKDQLAKANSLSALATYGTFPLAAGLLFGLTGVARWLEDQSGLSWLNISSDSLGFYVNSLTFLAAALIISLLGFHATGKFPFFGFLLERLPKPRATGDDELGEDGEENGRLDDGELGDGELGNGEPTGVQNMENVAGLMSPPPASPDAPDADASQPKGGLAAGLREFADGWRFIALTPIVRAVNFGLAGALIGGGLLIPLGVVFVEEILNAGTTGYVGLQITLGVGVGLGVVLITLLSKRIHTSSARLGVFTLCVSGACLSLLVAAVLSFWVGVIVGVTSLGICAGVIYVLGFTILHTEVSDEMRGRVFSGLYSLVRLCLILSLVLGGFLSELLDALVPDEISVPGGRYSLPGVRLTMCLGALIIGGAAVFIYKTARLERRSLKPLAAESESESAS